MTEVVSVNNPVNNSMHYGQKPVVGIIVPPDKLPSKMLFSAMDELQHYKHIEADLYQGELQAKPKKKGFPQVLKFTLGTIAVWLSYVVLKQPVVDFLKKIFHR